MTKENLAYKWASRVVKFDENNEVKLQVNKAKKSQPAKDTKKVVENILK